MGQKLSGQCLDQNLFDKSLIRIQSNKHHHDSRKQKHRSQALELHVLFFLQNVEDLQRAIDLFQIIEKDFNPYWIREHAKKFEESYFLNKLNHEIMKSLK